MAKEFFRAHLYFKNFSKDMNGKKILKNISFDIKENEILAILSPNG